MKCLGLFNSWLHSRSVFWALILCRYNLNNQCCMKVCKCMCCNCTLTLRECYWKQTHRSNFFSNPQICAQVLLLHPRAIPDPAPAALSTAPSSLWKMLWQSLSSLLISSALTTLSWLVSAGVDLHSFEHSPALSHMLCFWVMLSICGLYPTGTSQLSCLGVTPQRFCPWPLECGATFLQVDTMLLLLTSFNAFLPEDILLSHFLQVIPCIHPSI